MSHQQFKGDRGSEGQQKKTGRSSGPGHQRSGVPPPAVKGGGAGGPSPSGSAPPPPAVPLGGAQTSTAAAPARPTTPASSTNRGGKRANGPVGVTRSGSGGAPVDYGGTYKAPPYAGSLYHNQPPPPQQQAVVRQGLGPPDVNQHPPTSVGQQSETKQVTPRGAVSGPGGAPLPVPKQPYGGATTMAPGTAARPPQPSSSSAHVGGSESAGAAGSSVDTSRVSLQPAFSFQFGSIAPGFTGMQIPARTSSAPPNLDEQKREQARFEISRGIPANKVPAVPIGPPQAQVGRSGGNFSEPPAALQQNAGSQVAPAGPLGAQPQQQQSVHPPGIVQQQLQYSQGQVHSVPHQGNKIPPAAHIPPQVSSQQLHMQMAAQAQVHQAQAQAHQAHQAQAHQAQAHQAQAQAQAHQAQVQAQAHQAQAQAQAHQAQAQAQAHQAHAQQQVLAQQNLPQQTLSQQGMVQQGLSQGMKFPQSMMPPPHGPQMLSQQMGNPMAGQLSGQQVPSQMGHQMGPQMGGTMGGQLPPGITTAQYGPASNHIHLQRPQSRPVKIVHPETHEELRFEPKKKGDSFIESGPPSSASASGGLPVRVTGNGPPQTRASVTYNSGPHHTVVSNMNYFQPVQSGYAAPPYFQTVPPSKSGVSGAGGPPANAPPVRYSYGPQPTFMSHAGPIATSVGKVGPPGGLGITITTSDMTPSSPLIVSPIGGPPPPQPPTLAPVVPARVLPHSQPGGHSAPSSNGRTPISVPSTAASGNTSAPVTPMASSVVAFKFGDVDESGSAGATQTADIVSENSASNQMSSVNVSSSSIGDSTNGSHGIQTSDASLSRRDVGSRVSPATTPRPTVSVPTSKSASGPSAPSVSSPKVASSLVPVSSDKAKENAKPASISRENSTNQRKLSKREKAQRNQQQQQQLTAAGAPSADVEGESKGEASTATYVAAGTLGVGTEKASAASPKMALQRSQSGTHSSSASQAVKLCTGKSEEGKATPKGPGDLEKRPSAKLSVSSSGNFESGSAVQVGTAAEVDDSARKSSSKQSSGKSLTTSRSMEGKDPSSSESSSVSRVSAAAKLSSSSSKSLAVSAGKEAVTGQSGDGSVKMVSAGKTPASIESQKSDADTDSAVESTKIERLDVEGATSVSSDAPTREPDSVNGEEGLPVGVPKSPAESLKQATGTGDGTQSTGIISNQDDVKSSNPKTTSVPASDNISDLKKGRSSEPIDGALNEGTVSDPVPLRQQVTEGIDVVSGAALPLQLAETAASESSSSETATSSGNLRGDVKTRTEAVSKVGTPEEVTDLLGSSTTAPLENPRGKGATLGASSDSSVGAEPRKLKHKPAISVNVDSLPEVTDTYLPSNQPSGDDRTVYPLEKAHDGHRSEVSGIVEEQATRESFENVHNPGSNTAVEQESTSVPELRVSNSKRKKRKELIAKADAQGPTSDLFTAYLAPEEKRSDDQIKKSDVAGTWNPPGDVKKDPSTSEKPVLKEVEDWEDAVELPTPKIIPGVTNSASEFKAASTEAPNPGSGVRKYTRDFLLTQQNLNRDLPAQFEMRGDLLEIFYREGSSGDALPSPSGRSGDRQTGAGRGLDRRPSSVGAEEDRWIRSQSSASSPGRGPPDNIGMGGPPGGFRPGGQGRNAGLMGMPPAGMRPLVPQGLMQPGIGSGLLSGAPLLPQHGIMIPPSGPGRPMNPAGAGSGVDADRWQRAPQKGLIPSPRTPLPAIHKTENRYQVGRVSDEEHQKQRQIKSILNKLTPQNFDKLFAQVKEVHIESATTLTGVISQIFDKALTEPTFCEMYAKFCVQLAVELPEFVEEGEKITFKRVLLNKCQEEFERGEREQQEAEKTEEEGEVKLTDEEREEKRVKARRRMLGNIRFIGELYKKNMLTERIMHECIKKLLGEYQNPDEEDVEALCKLMSTIGRIIDHEKAKEHIDTYFRRMDTLSENHKLSPRLRFMLKDVIDLRKNGWQERRKVEGPKRIDEVHRDAIQERQPAGSGRDRLGPQRGMPSGGGRRPGSDFPLRGPQPPMYSQGGGMSGNMQMGGLRGAQPPPGVMRGGYGQDVRMEDRILMDSRPVPMPLSQRPSDDGPLTLGPQGGLGRGMASRPLVPGRSALADVPSMSYGEGRRPGMGHMPGYGGGMIPDRGPHGGREDPMSMRGPGAERSLGADRPLLERPMGPERLGPPGRDMRVPDRLGPDRLDRLTSDRLASDRLVPDRLALDRLPERPRTPYGATNSLRPVTPPALVAPRHSPSVSHALSEDELRKKSFNTVQEFYSVRDFREATMCVEDLKSPKFHPVLLSVWISDALEKKDIQRELLTELIVYLRNETGDPPLITSDHIFKGFQMVLSTMEEITVDVPRAREYVAGMFAKLIAAGIFSLPQVGSLLREGAMEPGIQLDSRDALIIFGCVLDSFRKEKGEEEMIALYRNSGLHLEDFIGPADKKRTGFESFLEEKKLQCLYPMIPVESYLRDAIDKDDPVGDIVPWLEKNVPQTTWNDPGFLRLIMKQVLRRSVPVENSKLAPHFKKSIEDRVRKYADLLRRFATEKANSVKVTEANQKQYILAVQLFANELGHPAGLVAAVFDALFSEEVIPERVFHQWQDDVKDLTPGRAEAIKDTFKWFQWLQVAPEDAGDED
ncbi:hypothetical protein R1flu_024185 [Riccia fluitans]|uniref:Eukaryotic translation initiation factor 4 gamma 2 n=1 Tax=Riccia fluitans TaxID=41844 RepID=A0ABD1XY84_9MARC